MANTLPRGHFEIFTEKVTFELGVDKWDFIRQKRKQWAFQMEPQVQNQREEERIT